VIASLLQNENISFSFTHWIKTNWNIEVFFLEQLVQQIKPERGRGLSAARTKNVYNRELFKKRHCTGESELTCPLTREGKISGRQEEKERSESGFCTRVSLLGPFL